MKVEVTPLVRFIAAAELARLTDTLRVLSSVARATDADRDAVKDAAAWWTIVGGGIAGPELGRAAVHRLRRRGGAR
jgi:hypothetical protein